MCIYKYRLSSQKNVLQIKLPNKNLKSLLFFVIFFLRGLIYKGRMKGRGCKATLRISKICKIDLILFIKIISKLYLHLHKYKKGKDNLSYDLNRIYIVP